MTASPHVPRGLLAGSIVAWAVLLAVPLLCSSALCVSAAQADEFEKARAAELAARRKAERESRLRNARARFFKYDKLDERQRSTADRLLTAGALQATLDRRPDLRPLFIERLFLNLRNSGTPGWAIGWSTSRLSPAYRATLPYYLLLASLHTTYPSLDMTTPQGRNAWAVSTDNPGYWYFVKGLTKDAFQGGADEDGVDYLLKALAIGGTGDRAGAVPWRQAIARFYATEYAFHLEREKKSAVWSSDLFDKIDDEGFFGFGQKYWVRRRRGRDSKRYSYSEVVAAINRANQARKRENEAIRQRNRAAAQRQAGEIQTAVRRVQTQLVEDLSRGRFKDQALVEASLIVLADYHRLCWRNPLLRELKDYDLDEKVLWPALYLFSQLHLRLAQKGKLAPYFIEDEAGHLLAADSVSQVRCSR